MCYIGIWKGNKKKWHIDKTTKNSNFFFNKNNRISNIKVIIV